MSALPATIEIIEVGPRDGLQDEPTPVSTSDKIAYVDAAIRAGLRRIEVASFVDPRRVPQMADAEAVVAGLAGREANLIGLVLNGRGMDRAIASGIGEINVVVAVSDTFGEKNSGMSIREAVKMWTEVAGRASAAGIRAGVTLSVAFGCPFEGRIADDQVVAIAGEVAAAGAFEISLADTIGSAVPNHTEDLVAAVVDAIGLPLRCHFHNSRNTGFANAVGALRGGATGLDSSIGGIGGCPFAPGATGNVATEDLVHMLHGMGIDTGVDVPRLLEAVDHVERITGRPSSGMLNKAGVFPRESMTIDLSVVATPLYFGSMAWENRQLKARAATHGPSFADYERPDTRTSLAMGVASLIVPVTQYLGRAVVPGKGRLAKVAIGAAVSAIAVTTIADRVAARRDGTPQGRTARRVAAAGSVTAIATTGVILTASTAYLGSATRLWRKGRHRDLGTGVRAWTLAMVGWDLAYYWNHRLQHEIRGMWAIHVVHHSSERFNLSTALRQPVASAFGVWVPYGWMARCGVRPSLIEYARGLNLIYQFWVHTDTVRSMGRAERVLNTPSHHRVHHGSNQRYLDRNHAGILIIWDRMFATFQPEDPTDPVVYGLTKNVDSFNLWRVMTHEYHAMFSDVARSTTWTDRLGYVLRGPGWSPQPVATVGRL